MAAATSVHVVAIVEPIIQHADWFFPEGEFCALSPSQSCLSLYLIQSGGSCGRCCWNRSTSKQVGVTAALNQQRWEIPESPCTRFCPGSSGSALTVCDQNEVL